MRVGMVLVGLCGLPLSSSANEGIYLPLNGVLKSGDNPVSGGATLKVAVAKADSVVCETELMVWLREGAFIASLGSTVLMDCLQTSKIGEAAHHLDVTVTNLNGEEISLVFDNAHQLNTVPFSFACKEPKTTTVQEMSLTVDCAQAETITAGEISLQPQK